MTAAPPCRPLVQAGSTAFNSAEDITVFAPSNDAFEAMDQDVFKKAMADPKGLLSTVLTYHVVPGTLTPQTMVCDEGPRRPPGPLVGV